MSLAVTVYRHCRAPQFNKYGIKKNIKTILDEPKIQNIFQDILHEANKYFIKSDEESKKIQKSKSKI